EAVALEIEGKTSENNTLDDAIGEEPEGAPLENRDKTMENIPNAAIGEVPEAVPLENRDKPMENALKDAPGEEPEAAVPVETEGKTIENTLNDQIGEEPEAAAPLENRGNTMEDTLNDSGSVSNTSPESALPGGTGAGSPSEHDGGGALYGDNPDSNFSLKSQGDLLQKEEHDDGGKLGASEATEVNATMPAETASCATGANSAAPVLEAGKPEEGA
ncbi:hypothetical protein ACDI75_26585, partial [Klebsiella pneumoniae]|uniref:hypothetical protein n=1 Tax=Klebsiella pneumoniae TaxID=573 RepID=UPI00353186DE